MKLDAHTTSTPLGSILNGVNELVNMDVSHLDPEQADIVEDILRDIDEQIWLLIDSIQGGDL